MEFTLSDIDGDSRRQNAFFSTFLFIKMTEKKNHPIKNFNLHKLLAHCRKWLTGKSKEISCAMTDHVISHLGSSAPFDVLTGIPLTDWQVLILTAIILLEINWHNLSTLIEWEVENFEQSCKINGCKNKAIKASNQRLNCPQGSLIIHQTFQRDVCKCRWQPLSLMGWKILRKS